MKIEKIHLNKIKVTFTPEDLIEHNITPEAVRNNAPWVQRVLMTIVRQAEEETGFVAHDARLMVEALPGEGDTMVMYITKLESEDDLKDALSAAKRKIRLKVRSAAPTLPEKLCVSFDNFEDAVSLAHFAQSEDTGELYFYRDRYHLILPADIAVPVSEFGRTSLDDKVCDMVSEHGKLVCSVALKSLREYF